jgi:hypothetical protein
MPPGTPLLDSCPKHSHWQTACSKINHTKKTQKIKIKKTKTSKNKKNQNKQK